MDLFEKDSKHNRNWISQENSFRNYIGYKKGPQLKIKIIIRSEKCWKTLQIKLFPMQVFNNDTEANRKENLFLEQPLLG
jgi:hypothetical protein